MPRRTPGGDFLPQIHAGVVMLPCSQGVVTASSSSWNIMRDNLWFPSLEHHDEGGSLLPGGHGQAQMFVSSHSRLQPQEGARHSWSARSRPCQESDAFHTDPGRCEGSCLPPTSPHRWITPFCSRACQLPLGQTSPLPSIYACFPPSSAS